MLWWRQWTILGVFGWAVLLQARPVHAAAEVKFDKEFLNGVITKLPPTSFAKRRVSSAYPLPRGNGCARATSLGACGYGLRAQPRATQ